ncbi:MAG TPA: PD-(D/E)XK nuclease family protein [Gemmatimonadales bacterium]|nr:PD-(D/E)XK nuclease family protein [Gemmatimonadales bacterium]
MSGVNPKVTSELARGEGPTRSVWTTKGPTAWPPPPNLMSYTALLDIETCPLRWGLRHGEYAGLWGGKGYPVAPAAATIAGHVVHVALERIVRAVGAAGEVRAGEPDVGVGNALTSVVEALRDLGGISAVLEGVVRDTVIEWESNPRLQPRVKELSNELERQLPTLRPRVQQFLSRVDLSRLRPGRDTSCVGGGEGREPIARSLSPGLHAEVPLVNDELGWYGKADLLRVGADTGAVVGDEIVDFKTGLPKPDHAFQLRIYALLWAREARRNPAGRRACKLTVMYGGEAVDVHAPATDEELKGVAHELAGRTAQARAAIRQHPPAPRPSREACEWCDVRQMCPAYWAPDTRAAILPPVELTRQQADVGVQVLQRQGAWSWVARVHELGALSEDVVVGARVLLRARPHDARFAPLLRVGERLRIVGAQCAAPSDESGGLRVLSLKRATEAYLLP